MRIVLYVIWALFVAGVIFALVRSLRKAKRQENNPAESTLPAFVVAKVRMATGLIMVIFGATAITMFASLSW
ncbi:MULTISPECIES: hypothetical protein [unclassified Arthrobacter]|uniref:hypothetical protein n=1 Tax=Pseudarthrobacter sp. S6 TaxID=3418420 RepID=UPI00339A7244